MDERQYLQDLGIKPDQNVQIRTWENATQLHSLAKLIKNYHTKQLELHIVSSSSKPEPPKPPLSRVLRTGVGRFCKNCNSTMSRYGFLMLFGKRYCDNKKCPNSKPEKNYY